MSYGNIYDDGAEFKCMRLVLPPARVLLQIKQHQMLQSHILSKDIWLSDELKMHLVFPFDMKFQVDQI